MLRRLALAALLALAPSLALAQVAFIAPTAPTSDNGNRIATTAFVQNAFAGNLALQSAAQLPSPFTGGTASGNTSKFMTGSGAFTNGDIAKFDTNGNVIDGGAASTGTVTSVTCGTGLSGGTFTTTGTCALALTNATLQASPANPTGTTSTAGVMMGLGTTCKLTPVYSGRVWLQFSTATQLSAATPATNSISARFGTGAAPANGAAAAGTIVGPAATAAVGTAAPFATAVQPLGGIITGLTPGTAYWFDIDLASGNAGGTATVINVGCTAMEF